MAQVLRDAEPDEVLSTVAFLSGELTQRRTGVGWASLRDLPAPATEPSLTVRDVDAAFEAISAVGGAGSAAERRRQVDALFGAATADEQAFLSGLARGDLRQGALESLVVDALARAAELPLADVRRAVMLRGSPGPVAQAILAPGADGTLALQRFRLEVGRPVQPMLAQTAPTSPKRWSARDRPLWSGSSTASACRCTRSATTCASSPGHWTRSATGSPRSSKSSAGWLSRPPCSTVRRSRCDPTDARCRSRSRVLGSAPRSTSSARGRRPR